MCGRRIGRVLAAVLLVFTAGRVAGEAAPAAAAAGRPQVPVLAWVPRSDWVDVKLLGARGDGVADDTAALQNAFSKASHGTTVYLPPGTYRLTATLRLKGPLVGVAVIGHGRETTLVWDGEPGGSVLADDGVAYARFVGLQFDGRNKAAVGFHHDSHTRFETEVRHQHLAFRGFTDAAVLAEPKDKFALAETTFENCLFEDCGRGVVFVSFNDYDYTFDGCEFVRCRIGIECEHGNFYVRNCHFVDSREVDIHAAPEHASSVRRCSSVGSRAFLRHANHVAPLTIQDCQVQGWTSPDGAVTLNSAPVMMFDCRFQGGPDGRSPVRLLRSDQRLILSGNRAEGAAGLIQDQRSTHVYAIPPGRQSSVLETAQQRFLRDVASVPTRIFDAKRDFGAKGDGRTDDTAAIQRAINAAREHAHGALAYLPTGTYAISGTLHITGRDYAVGGSGFMSRLTWKGPAGGIMVAVHDPLNVMLEHLAIGNHDTGAMDNGIDVLQTGSDKPSRMVYDGVWVYGMYQKQPLRKGLHLRGLGSQAVVLFPHVQGNLRFVDSAAATVLVNCSYEGSVVVEGKGRQRDGFLGFQTRLSTITTHGLYLRDNHSIVMSDFYIEQADAGYVLEGGPDDPPGRATLQGAKVDFTHQDRARDGTVLDIRNYAGEVFFGPNQFYASLPRVPIVHRGERKVDLFLWGNCFYKTHLEAQKTPGLSLHLLGNQGVAVTDPSLSPENRAADNLPAIDLTRLSAALDDLRRLGALDLHLNHARETSRLP